MSLTAIYERDQHRKRDWPYYVALREASRRRKILWTTDQVMLAVYHHRNPAYIKRLLDQQRRLCMRKASPCS